MRALAVGLAVTGLLLLLVLALCTLFDGMLRAFANYPLDFVREIGELVAAISGASCLPLVVLERGNITLRVLDNWFSPAVVRTVDLANAVVIEVILIAMAWQFYLYSVKTMRAGEITLLLSIPKAPFWFVVDGLLWVTAAVQGLLAVQQIVQLRGAPSRR